VRLLFAFVFAFLPMRVKRFVAKWIYKWDVDPTAYIGPSVLTVRHLSMGPGAAIGGRNVITNLNELRMAAGSSIGSGNLIKGWWDHPTDSLTQRNPAVILGAYSQIASYHYIDCVDTLELGHNAALAGFRSTVMTHSIDLVRDRYVTGSVVLGPYAGVMSGCMLLAGARVPARSIVSAGSVVTTRLTQELTLYRGNPAEAVRLLPRNLAYLNRGDQPAGLGGERRSAAEE
jgi:acetyltransferase-like isoleucine patch superfamily enzyme